MKKKIFTLIVFIILILMVTVGYAILSANLSINGTSTINNSSWNIHFANVRDEKNKATTTTAATLDSTQTEISYEVSLNGPGSYYMITTDIKNEGTIDGMVEGITSTLNGSDITTLPSYLVYEYSYTDGVPIEENQFLKAGQTKTITLKIGYKLDVDINELPTTEQALNIRFKIDYKQADSTAIDKPNYVYTYDETTCTIGQGIPDTVTVMDGYDLAFIAFGHDFLLRHTMLNSKIQSTAVIIPYGEGILGYEAFIGGDDGAAFNANKAKMLSLFRGDYCNDLGSSMLCTKTGLLLSVSDDGAVLVGDFDKACEIKADKTSYCYDD